MRMHEGRPVAAWVRVWPLRLWAVLTAQPADGFGHGTEYALDLARTRPRRQVNRTS